MPLRADGYNASVATKNLCKGGIAGMKLPRFALVGVLSLAAIVTMAGAAGASANVSGTPAQNCASLSLSVAHEDAGHFKGEHGGRGSFVLSTAAGFFGMQPQDLRTELKNGKSLKDVAVAKGKDPNVLAQRLQSAFSEKLDLAVKSGKLQQAKADSIKAKLPQRVETLMSKTWQGKEDKPFAGSSCGKHFRLFRGVNDQVQNLLGLDSAQLKTALKSGKSLAQLAQEKGIAQETLENKIQATLEDNLAQALKDGKITAEAAAQLKADLPQQVKAMVARQHLGKSQS